MFWLVDPLMDLTSGPDKPPRRLNSKNRSFLLELPELAVELLARVNISSSFHHVRPSPCSWLLIEHITCGLQGVQCTQLWDPQCTSMYKINYVVSRTQNHKVNQPQLFEAVAGPLQLLYTLKANKTIFPELGTETTQKIKIKHM